MTTPLDQMGKNIKHFQLSEYRTKKDLSKIWMGDVGDLEKEL